MASYSYGSGTRVTSRADKLGSMIDAISNNIDDPNKRGQAQGALQNYLISQGMDASDVTISYPALISLANQIRSAGGVQSYMGGGTGAPGTGGGMPGVGGGGGGGYGSVNDLINATKSAFDEAKAANEARYGAIRGGESDVDAASGGWKGLRERSLGYVDAISNQQEVDAQRRAQQRMGAMGQSMVSAGLSGTTIPTTLAMGLNREADAEQRRIQDAKMQKRLGVDADTTNELLKFMERRTDAYPNYAQYANMLQQAGQYGSGVSRYSGTMPTAFTSGGSNLTDQQRAIRMARKRSMGGTGSIWGGDERGKTGYADQYADPFGNTGQMMYGFGGTGASTGIAGNTYSPTGRSMYAYTTDYGPGNLYAMGGLR